MLVVRRSRVRSASLALVASLASLLAPARDTRPSSDPELHGELLLRSPAGPSAHFVDGRAQLTLAGRSFSLAASSIRRARGAVQVLARGTSRVVGDEVHTTRGPGVVEWWKALPRGLEHGLTLAARPAGEGELVVALDLDGALVPRRDADGVALVDDADRAVARYHELAVIDATGRTLPSSMQVAGDRIDLVFSDEGARYPVVVDPMLYGEEHRFEVAAQPDHSEFGVALALSADGSVLAIGAPNSTNGLTGSSTDPGAVYVFERAGAAWSQTQKLVASDGEIGECFGSTIAISSDGSRIVVGAPYESDPTIPQAIQRGAAYVFARSGAGWSEEQQLLAETRALGNDAAWFGTAVGISGDGATIAVGEPYTGGPNGRGFVFVFTRSGTTWSETGELYEPHETGPRFGSAVAVSSDGDRIAVGSPMADEVAESPSSQTGVAYVFARAATWERELRVSPGDARTADRFGSAVALDATGSRLLVGAFAKVEEVGGEFLSIGAAYVFARSGSSWSEEATLLADGRAADDAFGASVALSADGALALIGAHGTASDREHRPAEGAAWVFRRDGTEWEDDARLIPREPRAHLGYAVGASADGTRLAVGALGLDDERDGAAYVFRLGADGLACSDGGADCASGFCVDGVCCDAACGGGAGDDCQACRSDLTGQADGVCTTLATPACLPDAGPGTPDGGSVVPDAGEEAPDAGADADAGAALPTGGGCGCAVGGSGSNGSTNLGLALILVGLLVGRAAMRASARRTPRR